MSIKTEQQVKILTAQMEDVLKRLEALERPDKPKTISLKDTAWKNNNSLPS